MPPYLHQNRQNKVLLLDMDHTIIDTKKYHSDGEIGKNIYPNVVNFLKDMGQKGYKIGIVTHSMGNDGDKARPSALLEKVKDYLEDEGVKIDATSEPYHLFQRNIPELLSYLDKLPNNHPNKKFLDQMDNMDLFQFRYQVLIPLMGKGSGTGLTPLWDNIRKDLGVTGTKPVDLIMMGDSKTDATFAVELADKYKNINAKAIFLTHKLLKHYAKINPTLIDDTGLTDDVSSDTPLINDYSIKHWLSMDRTSYGKAYVNPITRRFTKNGNMFLLHNWNRINDVIKHVDPNIQTAPTNDQPVTAQRLNNKFLPSEASSGLDSDTKASFVQRYTSGSRPTVYSYVNALLDAKTHPASSLGRAT